MPGGVKTPRVHPQLIPQFGFTPVTVRLDLNRLSQSPQTELQDLAESITDRVLNRLNLLEPGESMLVVRFTGLAGLDHQARNPARSETLASSEVTSWALPKLQDALAAKGVETSEEPASEGPWQRAERGVQFQVRQVTNKDTASYGEDHNQITSSYQESVLELTFRRVDPAEIRPPTLLERVKTWVGSLLQNT